ncbi:nicotinamide riboside transporter PnuC [Flammeovirga kamogawensis]|uniref:Nicotinamide riboside transporter PnuC n=1 Tax=Flammeovirga kamogawensis TaxID=373891 RepID=A0ABX8GYU6_9BACT|nr:nicotinamide riboside transporter PnuC [Flammeovirga kamogawensis]MBB6459227.1 nicotinamide mononucleotide transporter [Flammeovirga kamogawensis]QWG08791.1 nicotinamide riboside transporter PnuC [Flammeovirga kamogawensis]TRX67081.1 nicotinamide mononucleotide transporter [Flammeovirga kamogawensis]
MSWIEIIAVVFSVMYTVLAIKENIWCWAAAVVSVSLYMYLCIDAKLYAETGLQVFYFCMNIFGFWQWKYGKNNHELPLSELSFNKHLIAIGLASVLVFMLGYFLSENTDASLPYLDSFTTIFSIMATFMVARKIVSNWAYWVIIDAVSIYLYYTKGFELTAGLFLAYTLLAAWGLFKWRKEYSYAKSI